MDYNFSKGIDLIRKWEGLRLCAYKCPAGVWTIGYGHTAGVKEGDVITSETALKYLEEDIKKITENPTFRAFCNTYELSNNQACAMLSFCFNGGIGWLKQVSASYTRSRDDIGEKMKLYNKANGKVLQGLVNRRNEESALFFTPDSVLPSDSKGEYMVVSFYRKDGTLERTYRVNL